MTIRRFIQLITVVTGCSAIGSFAFDGDTAVDTGSPHVTAVEQMVSEGGTNDPAMGTPIVDAEGLAAVGDVLPTVLPVDTGVSVTAGTTASVAASQDVTEQTTAAAAQQEQSLDRMVVSATRTRRRMSETPASVTVISRQEIETSAAKDINDLVMNKTGVQVRRPVGMGEGVPSDISMRGIPGALAAARTLILVDGIPTNASGTPFLILNEIPIDIIENIEIVRGPYSSLYGANAFGGVINVITKKGDGAPHYGVTFENSYPFSVLESWLDGERIGKAAKTGRRQALWNGNLLASGGNSRVNYLVNAGYRTIGNYLMSDSALVKTPHLTYHIPAKNYGYTDWRLFGKLGLRISENCSVEFHTRYFNSDLGFGVTRYSPDTSDINIQGEKIVVGPQLVWKVAEGIDIKAGGYLRRINGSYMNEMNGMPISWESNSDDWQLDLQSIVHLLRGHVFTIGAEFLSNKITFGNLVNAETDSVISKSVTDRISNAGAYIQDEIVIAERLRIVPGLRMDYHTVFLSAFSPKLGVSYAVNDRVHLRSSAGRAFRAPNHTELFMPALPVTDTVPLISNPKLNPEYIWAFDAGADYMPVRGIRLSASTFYNRMRDLIGQGIVVTDAYDYFVTHQNISSAWSAGIECDIEARVHSSLTLKGGYVYQRSRNKSASDDAAYFKKWDLGQVTTTSIELDYIPNHKASIGAVFTRKVGRVTLSVSVDEMIVGERHYLNFGQIRFGSGEQSDVNLDPITREVTVAPPYELLPRYLRTDLLIRCNLGNWFGTVALQNLFNATFQESFGTRASGLLATVKLGAEF